MLIKQRADSDCAICAIAMATGRTYEEVIAAAGEHYSPDKGCWAESKILEALGYRYTFASGRAIGDFISLRRGYDISPEFFRDMAWGRRALFGVPSLNNKGGFHMVYWDGRKIFDPSNKKTYRHFDQLLPVMLILFREIPSCAGLPGGAG